MSFQLIYVRFRYLATRSYFKGDKESSFVDAKSYCEDRGTTLASIPTYEDYVTAYSVCPEIDGCWIGLQDDIVEGIWSWTDGTDISSSYGFHTNGTATNGKGPWWYGEPNNSGDDEDCVEMTSGKYNDLRCTTTELQYPLCNQGISLFKHLVHNKLNIHKI